MSILRIDTEILSKWSFGKWDVYSETWEASWRVLKLIYMV